MLGLLSKLVRKAYGEKSGDGKRFLKNKELEDGFATTDAFSNLLIELVNDEKKLEAFVTGVIPAEMREEVEKRMEESREAEAADKPKAKVVDMPKGDPIEMN